MATEIYETPFSPDEFARLLAESRASMRGPDGDEVRAQIEWFLRRDPTPLERLQYARRKYRVRRASPGTAAARSSDS